MSRVALMLSTFVCLLYLKALAGWVCDGASVSTEADALQGQVTSNATAIVGLSESVAADSPATKMRRRCHTEVLVCGCG